MNNQSFLNLPVHDGHGNDASEWSRNDAVTETFIYLHTCFCYYTNKAGICNSLETLCNPQYLSHNLQKFD
jgi:hypothetical protein